MSFNQDAVSNDKSALDLLTLVLEAASFDSPDNPLRYQQTGTPERWEIYTGQAALAVQPLPRVPWFLFDRSKGSLRLTLLCTPPIGGNEIVDLARRASPAFGRGGISAATLASILSDFAEKDVCDSPPPGVIQHRRAAAEDGVPLLFGTDDEHRLVVAPAPACETGMQCPLNPQRSEPDMPQNFAWTLLAALESSLQGSADTAAGLRLVHDDGPSRVGGLRRVLFTFPGQGDTEPSRVIIGFSADDGATCIPAAIHVRVSLDGQKMSSFEDISSGADRDRIVERLLTYLSARYNALPTGACNRLSTLEPFLMVLPDRIEIFEEGYALGPGRGTTRYVAGPPAGSDALGVRIQSPRQTSRWTTGDRPATRIAPIWLVSVDPGSPTQFARTATTFAMYLGNEPRRGSVRTHNEAGVSGEDRGHIDDVLSARLLANRPGVADRSGAFAGRLIRGGFENLPTRIVAAADPVGASPFATYPRDDPKLPHVRIEHVPGVSGEERGRIYKALLPYLRKPKQPRITLKRIGAPAERLYKAPYESGSTLVIATGDVVGAAHFVVDGSRLNEIPRWTFKTAIQHRPQQTDTDDAPSISLLRKGPSSVWLLAPDGPGKVVALGKDVGPTVLGSLTDKLDRAMRLGVLDRVSAQPDHFCVKLLERRLWLTFAEAVLDCNELESSGSMRAWSLWNRSVWTQIRTNIAPEMFPVEMANAVLTRHLGDHALRPSLQVTRHQGSQQIFSVFAPCAPGLASHAIARIGAVYRITETKPSLSPWETFNLLDSSEEVRCIELSDLELLLDSLANDDTARLQIIANLPESMTGFPVLRSKTRPELRVIAAEGIRAEVFLELIPEPHKSGSEPSGEASRTAAEMPDNAWDSALRAVAEAGPADVAGPDDDTRTGSVLAIERTPSNTGGRWILSGRKLTATIRLPPSSMPLDPVKVDLEISPEAFETPSKRHLIALLLRELLDRMEAKMIPWPDNIIASGKPPFLASIDGAKGVEWLVATPKLASSVELTAVGFGPRPEVEPLRESLRAAFADWDRDMTATVSAEASTENNGISVFALNGSARGQIVRMGHWLPTGFLDVSHVRSANAPASRIPNLSSALRNRAKPGAQLRLDGSNAALRLCSDTIPEAHIVALTGTSPHHRPSFDMEIWRNGKQLHCAIAEDNEDLSRRIGDLASGITAKELLGRIAAVLPASSTPVKPRVAGLIGHSPVKGDPTPPSSLVLRANGQIQSSGCLSVLRGDGASLLASLLMHYPDLQCHQLVHPIERDQDDQSPPRTAAISIREELYLARPDCAIALQRNQRPGASTEMNEMFVSDLLADFVSAACPEETKGRWLLNGTQAFVSVTGKFRMVNGPTVSLPKGHIHQSHEIWLSEWLVSPGAQFETGWIDSTNLNVAAGPTPSLEFRAESNSDHLRISILGSHAGFGNPLILLDATRCHGVLVDKERNVSRGKGTGRWPTGTHLKSRGRNANYICRQALIWLSHLQRGTETPRALVHMQSDSFLRCLLALPDALDRQDKCIEKVQFADNQGTELLTLAPDASIDISPRTRMTLLADLLDPTLSNERDRAEQFLSMLVGGWQIVSTTWSPNYHYILTTGIHGSVRHRFDAIGARCREIDDKYLRGVIEDRCVRQQSPTGVVARTCVIGSSLLALVEIGKRTRTETPRATDPVVPTRALWYRNLFTSDPRHAIASQAKDCA